MAGTFIEDATKMLNELAESRDFDDLYEYAVSLACQLMDSYRVGRAMDRAIERTLPKKVSTILYRNSIFESFDTDDFTDEEEEFLNRFCDMDEDDY